MPTVQVDLTPVEAGTDAYGFDERDIKYLNERAVPLKLAYDEGLCSITKDDVNEKRRLYRMSEQPSGGLWIQYTTTMVGESHCARLRYWEPPSKDKKFTSSAGTAIPYIARILFADRALSTVQSEGSSEINHAQELGCIAQDVTVPLFFAEGPIKALALIAADFGAIGLGGVESGFFDKAHKDATKEYILHPMLKSNVKFDGRLVYIVYDAGRVSNPCVARGEGNLARVLRAAGAHVKLVQLPLDENGKDQGPDDYLAKHGKDAFQKLVDAAIPGDPIEQARACSTKDDALTLLKSLAFAGSLYVGGEPTQKAVEDDLKVRLKVNRGDVRKAVEWFDAEIKKHTKEHRRPKADAEATSSRANRTTTIRVSSKIHENVGEACNALRRARNLYCREGRLVSIAKEDSGDLVIQPVELSVFTNVHLSKLVNWEQWDRGKSEWVPTLPSRRVAETIFDMKIWGQDVRVIRGISTIPLMRPDGTILQQPGYDEQTKIFYHPTLKIPELPESPTREDAIVAKDKLLELLKDFPIVGAGKSTWLSGLLTLVGRDMFFGPTPFHLFDANAPRTGKTMLAKLVVAIVEGEDLPVKPLPTTDEEQVKSFTSILRGTRRSVLFDNLSQDFPFGSDTLCALSTGNSWSGRLLGQSEELKLANRILWCGTGVNIAIRGDTAGRCILCRIETDLEHPELRSGLPDVVQTALDNRAEYLGAVLTILRAWVVAGKPQGRRDLGSFEAWSRTIGACIEWLGLKSPIVTKDEHEERTGLGGGLDPAAEFLAAWQEKFPEFTKVISVVDRLVEDQAAHSKALRDGDEEHKRAFERLREAILGWCPAKSGSLPSAKYLGTRMGKIENRTLDGLRLTSATVNHVKTWKVMTVDEVGISLDDAIDEAPPGSAGSERGLNDFQTPLQNHNEFSEESTSTGSAGSESEDPLPASVEKNKSSEKINFDTTTGECQEPIQSPQSPSSANSRAGSESIQSPSDPESPGRSLAPESATQPAPMVQSPADPYRGVAVMADGHDDKVVIHLRSDCGERFIRHIPRAFPHIVGHLTAMGFESVPAVGEEIKVCTPRRLLWDCLDADRGLAGFVEVVAA